LIQFIFYYTLLYLFYLSDFIILFDSNIDSKITMSEETNKEKNKTEIKKQEQEKG